MGESVVVVDDELEIFDEGEDRPIMLVFRRLLFNNSTTTLTNAQIFDILRLEFNVNVTEMHELEISIYLNLIKKFLKDWPKWGQFERVINRLRAAKAADLLKTCIEDKYRALKDYLNQMLSMAKPMAEITVKQCLEVTTKNTELENVILEVSCTRDQLNHLFYRHPTGDLSTDIFNINEPIQSKIILTTWDISSVLNMWNVRMNINLNSLIYKRETTHKLEHMLMNETNGQTALSVLELDQRTFERSNKSREFDTKMILNNFNVILKAYETNNQIFTLLSNVFSVIEDDLINTPSKLKYPSKYKQYLSKYPYVRYLYTDNSVASTSSSTEKYDFKLREIVSPSIEYYIGKVDSPSPPQEWPPFQDWFRIECGICKINFMGEDLSKLITDHFTDNHHNGPDWECAKCELKFDMKKICEGRWRHDCS